MVCKQRNIALLVESCCCSCEDPELYIYLFVTLPNNVNIMAVAYSCGCHRDTDWEPWMQQKGAAPARTGKDKANLSI